MEPNSNSVNSDKKVSFVVPIYKTEKYLENCLKSLLNQDYKNLEVVCVADGKNNKAEKIFNKLKKTDNRLIKYTTIPHSGAPAARNAGYLYTSGDYISFWDSDCYAEPGMVRMWMKIFSQYPDISFVYSGYRFNDSNLTFYPSEPFNPYLLTCNNYIANMFPMKREIFPGYDEKLKSLQDWDMWLTLVEKGHKGFFLEGSAFITEPPLNGSISSVGCNKENWLDRYEAIRNKHNITNRKICFISVLHKFRGIDIAKMFNQDYLDSPSYHPHRYKMIYCIGFYANSMNLSSEAFKNLPPGCQKVIHWIGEDIETLFMLPYKAVKVLKEMLIHTIDKHYCENEQSKKMLNELGIQAKILPLPMEFEEIQFPEKFKIYYEYDNSTKQLIDSIIKACPDIEFESPNICLLKDYSCFLSLTESIMPSENFKRFLAGGRYVITNHKMLYAGNIELSKEKIIKRIREHQKTFRKSRQFNTNGMKYYKDIIEPERFQKEVIDNV